MPHCSSALRYDPLTSHVQQSNVWQTCKRRTAWRSLLSEWKSGLHETQKCPAPLCAELLRRMSPKLGNVERTD